MASDLSVGNVVHHTIFLEQKSKPNECGADGDTFFLKLQSGKQGSACSVPCIRPCYYKNKVSLSLWMCASQIARGPGKVWCGHCCGHPPSWWVPFLLKIAVVGAVPVSWLKLAQALYLYSTIFVMWWYRGHPQSLSDKVRLMTPSEYYAVRACPRLARDRGEMQRDSKARTVVFPNQTARTRLVPS